MSAVHALASSRLRRPCGSKGFLIRRRRVLRIADALDLDARAVRHRCGRTRAYATGLALNDGSRKRLRSRAAEGTFSMMVAQANGRRRARSPARRGSEKQVRIDGRAERAAAANALAGEAGHPERSTSGRAIVASPHSSRRNGVAGLVLAGAVLAFAMTGPAWTQVAPSGPPPDGPASRSDLRPGSNSFTEGQARQRLEKLGYERIGPLRKDDDGIWRGSAEHGGRQVEVGMDYRGAVVRSGKEE